MRIDKFLAHAGYGSRKDVKALIRKGRVSVGREGKPAARPETKIDPDTDTVFVDGEAVEYAKYIYLMMNKPAGVISATTDPAHGETTVSELAEEAYGLSGLFPVGRLDKDATGLIILTNDGVFAHRATSPKKGGEKVYDVEVSGELTERDAEAFREGVRLEDGYLCREALLEVQESGPVSRAFVTVTEGKFHQIKRMFEAVGKRVLTLRRVSFCGIPLPEDLPEGEARPLSAEELEIIGQYISHE